MKYRNLDWGDLVEVGDFIVVETFLGKRIHEITRVTKTLAVSLEGGNEFRCKRKVSPDMAHPAIEWNSNTYKVYRPVAA